AAMDVWVGTSGYSFSDWVGPFYPKGTRPGRMLPYYTRHFPLVELNFSFYRPPTRNALVHLAEKTPAGVQFLVKLPQTPRHPPSVADLPGFRHAVEGLEARHQLAGLLCQLPQATRNKDQAREWLRRLADELGHLRLAVEFRHRSWARPDVPGWLGEHRLDLV